MEFFTILLDIILLTVFFNYMKTIISFFNENKKLKDRIAIIILGSLLTLGTIACLYKFNSEVFNSTEYITETQ